MGFFGHRRSRTLLRVLSNQKYPQNCLCILVFPFGFSFSSFLANKFPFVFFFHQLQVYLLSLQQACGWYMCPKTSPAEAFSGSNYKSLLRAFPNCVFSENQASTQALNRTTVFMTKFLIFLSFNVGFVTFSLVGQAHLLFHSIESPTGCLWLFVCHKCLYFFNHTVLSEKGVFGRGRDRVIQLLVQKKPAGFCKSVEQFGIHTNLPLPRRLPACFLKMACGLKTL